MFWDIMVDWNLSPMAVSVKLVVCHSFCRIYGHVSREIESFLTAILLFLQSRGTSFKREKLQGATIGPFHKGIFSCFVRLACNTFYHMLMLALSSVKVVFDTAVWEATSWGSSGTKSFSLWARFETPPPPKRSKRILSGRKSPKKVQFQD